MLIRGLLVFFVVVCLISCVKPAYQRPTYQASTATHQYEVSVKDINGTPIEGADIAYTIRREHKDYDSGKFTTKSDGKFTTSVTYTSSYQYIGSKFSSELKYKISKEGYYTASGSKFVAYDGNKTATGSVTLLKPIDYINPAFLSSPKGTELKTKILTFIDLIRLQSLLADADLKPQTINLVTFKEKDYL